MLNVDVDEVVVEDRRRGHEYLIAVEWLAIHGSDERCVTAGLMIVRVECPASIDVGPR